MFSWYYIEGILIQSCYTLLIVLGLSILKPVGQAERHRAENGDIRADAHEARVTEREHTGVARKDGKARQGLPARRREGCGEHPAAYNVQKRDSHRHYLPHRHGPK